MPRGGRRSTTWTSNWKSGETKRIRIPSAIADEVIAIAHQIDRGKLDPTCLVPRQKKAEIACPKAKTTGVIAVLEEGLKLRANAGGKIKAKIREAIALLNDL